MISMDKTYRCDGSPMRILCIDAGGRLPVIGMFDSGTVLYFTAEGLHSNPVYNLVEVSPYDDFKIDERVMVREGNDPWMRRYFSGVTPKGIAKTFLEGRNKWSAAKTNDTVGWSQCRRPTAEELAA